ncbi:Hypothetical protein MELLADRAFT_71595 [Melampsora larici-populina 98AG31]|uniref:DUF676 domain-containing protein n=1 Tax=Melampsora larici-populina (strain 98AG31 / pathotype 3-4-7) TaxID=747676 RepID=F4RIA5_MELLP|nr:Hypothetical protein MELLADRAFT_71595 [Melampsora larici-populina 98AG31]EGG07974.1 Hypothetical protein MELLADRAFT_71595 [Melampsora larici-populina 98AG31]
MSLVQASQDFINTAIGAPAILLLVWLHGFKGGDDTFGTFPERIKFLCSETWSNTQTESIVYPAYDTRGSLAKASELFLDWLTVKTSEIEAVVSEERKERGLGDGKREKAYIVLLGHSMGGLVLADATLKLLRDRDSASKLHETIVWPGIIGLIGYDTPYYGLNPAVFANAANEYLKYAKSAQEIASGLGLGLGALGWMSGSTTDQASKDKTKTSQATPSGSKKKEEPAPSNANKDWWKMGMAAAGVAGLAAAAGTSYWQKDAISENFTWASSHLDFVGELWKGDNLKKRVIEVIDTQPTINFHCFYTEIPKVFESKSFSDSRHLIVLPDSTIPRDIRKHFTANRNIRAKNEIDAHISMFNEKENSGYWALGKDTVQHITQWLEAAHLHRTKLIQSQHAATQEKQDKVDDEDLRDRKDRADAAQQRVTEELDKEESRDEL